MHVPLRASALVAAALVTVGFAGGCGTVSAPRSASAAGAQAGTADPASDPAVPSATPTPTVASPAPSPSVRPSRSPSALPLAGRVIGIDPGHNGGNFSDPGFINQLIWNGREDETCDTTGTETTAGFTEAAFTFAVATDLRADLVTDGATVVMTRHSNDGVGPCVTTRAQIIDSAHAAVAIDIHADGGPTWGRGFTVLEPVADGPNDAVIGSSLQFGADVRAALLHDTTMPTSDYYGSDGLISRNDLAGLNLTTVPKVLVECGNMRNSTDAVLLTSAAFQRQLARAFTAAIIVFLTGRPA